MASKVATIDDITAIQEQINKIMLKMDNDGFIDLGLPSGTLWATGNFVADGNGGYKIGNETDYGAYFSWANIVPHFSSNGSTFDDGYDFGTSISGPYASTPGKNLTTDIASNNATYSVSKAYLGGSPWYIPSKDTFNNLRSYTDYIWTTIDGVSGYKFMNKKDHRAYIFLPACGYGYGKNVVNRNVNGLYWTTGKVSTDYAYTISFTASSANWNNQTYRFYGLPIRVCKDNPF